jgi:FAD/FMN-containing dehydrogenase
MSSQPVIATNGRPLDEAAVQELISTTRGQVIRPEDAGYDDARAVWNGMIDRRPALIMRCTGAADVIEAVNFAREQGLAIAVRGGGHNVAGNAVADDALVVDLSSMRGVHVDPKARTVRVQGGATWGDVDRETQIYGLATAGGVVSPTGVAGLTLHGGMGHLRRKYGLSIDNLLSVDIVTADGQIQTASEKEDQDLFWAVRGAGSNFGVVTSFEFKLHPVGPEVFLCAPLYAAEDAPGVLPKWREFMSSAPEEISSIALFWSVPEGFPEEYVGKPVLILAAVHSGSAEEGERETQPLREMGTPILDLSAAEPYTTVQTGFDPFFPDGNLYYWKSMLADELTDEMIDQLCQLGTNRPSPGTTVEMWHHGGAMHRVGMGETAFGGRGATYMLTFEPGWTDPAESERNIAWARQAWSRMYRYASRGLYLNFPGFGEEKEDIVRDSYGSNYERLARLKARYDPDNLFRFNQNIKPAKREYVGI